MDQLAEVRRGEEANRLLDHPLMKEAFDNTRNGILEAMNKSAFGDQSTHHHLVIALQLLGQIEKSLRDTAVTGKMAGIQLDKGIAGRIRGAVGF